MLLRLRLLLASLAGSTLLLLLLCLGAQNLEQRPTLNLGFGGEDEGGIYHSIYDDFFWYTHFSDTDFAYGRALAQTVGLAVLRLADAEDVADAQARLVEPGDGQVLAEAGGLAQRIGPAMAPQAGPDRRLAQGNAFGEGAEGVRALHGEGDVVTRVAQAARDEIGRAHV